MKCNGSIVLTASLALAGCGGGEALADFEFRKGDRICLIGNTLADRMQHHGWLETILQSRHPDDALVFRNLGFSGDELTLRLRSKDFGSPDDHLRRVGADVIFAFFGYNESFAGPAGLAKFQQDLREFIEHSLAQNYDGDTAPRLVMFSPIAHEDLGGADLPDGSANNQRLAIYTRAMAEVAADFSVPFVDLYAATRELYAESAAPLTINGIHLNEVGNRQLALVIAEALATENSKPIQDAAALARIRSAVLDKNLHWFNRYRTTDGYSIFGGRGGLAFVDGQTNWDVIERELEILDIMTANRDARIWAVAKGGDLVVDDSNTPPLIGVKTNKPGDGKDGEHVFLSGEAAIAMMTVAEGMKINLFASEEQFPALVNPNQTAIDPQGRLWVSAWPTYPHWQPQGPMNDKLLILPDDDGDGRADRCIVFADGLHNPTGFEFWGGGVLVAQVPDLLFLQDTDGDDRADVRVRVLHGIDSADTHHSINSFVIDPGGALYFQEGTFHHTQVETPYGAPVRSKNAAVYRYEPRTQKFEVYVDYGFANPHGHVFDRWGQDFITDGTGAQPYYGTAFSGKTYFPRKHPRAPQVYQQRTRPCSGTVILSSRHFPDDNQGNWLVANVIGFQGILQYQFQDDGSGFTAVEVEPIVHSTDPNFRPTDMEIGADGAIYFSEWQNPIIGHMQHNLRDPSRDRLHGRVYRVTYPSRPLLVPLQISGAAIADLVKLLETEEDSVRARVRIELSARAGADVLAAIETWVKTLDASDQAYQHHLAEALWVYQHHNVVNEVLLRKMLRSPDFRARAAATRVLCSWRDRVNVPLELLRVQAADQHPRVRLEAVRACSFLADARSAEIALMVLAQPMDRFLSYTLQETLKTLEPQWLAAITMGVPFAESDPEGLAYALDQLDRKELLKLPRKGAVCVALLTRAGIDEGYRRQALRVLAEENDRDELSELLAAIANDQPGHADLCLMLAAWNVEALRTARDKLSSLATSSESAGAREAAYAAWITADGTAERAWESASTSMESLRDLLAGICLLEDPSVLGSLYGEVRPLMFDLPEALRSTDDWELQAAAVRAASHLPGDGTQKFADFARLIGQGEHRDAAIDGVLAIPREQWPAVEAMALATEIVAIAKTTQLALRNSPAFEPLFELGQELTETLPENEANELRRSLSGLAPLVIRIRTVPSEMRYDRTEIIVIADRPVRIIFQNPDMMQHNLLIVLPGAIEEVGSMAEAMGAEGVEKQYIPDSDKILHATRMLNYGESVTLDFVAPSEIGDYGMVCTFPEHWRLMQGIMRVVPSGG